MKKKVIVVCCHMSIGRGRYRDYDFLQPMAGLHLASLINPDNYEIRLYHELYQGPYDAKELLNGREHFDVAVFTGLQKDFDRMRQLSYFFRRSGAVTVAGGSICTLFPDLCERYFDAVCVGDVDSVIDVFSDYEKGNLQKRYRSKEKKRVVNRIYSKYLREFNISCPVHHIEASRGCNYTCGFCTLPGENARHKLYDLQTVIENIEDSIAESPFFSVRRHYPILFFIDNHFAIDAKHIEFLCNYIKGNKRIKGWGALVSQNVLSDRDTIKKMADSGCFILFAGIESFDLEFLKKHSKRQNIHSVQNIIDDIDFAQRNGILIIYGWLFDPCIASISEMYRQIDALVESETLLFPSFFSFVSPLLGTKVYLEKAQNRELRPGLNLRDLDGMTVAFNNCLEPDQRLTEVARQLFDKPHTLVKLSTILTKTFRFILNYRIVNPLLLLSVLTNNFRIYRQARIAQQGNMKFRNYLGGKDLLDPQYLDYPDDITEEDRQRYFEPLKVVDEDGGIPEWIGGTMERQPASPDQPLIIETESNSELLVLP